MYEAVGRKIKSGCLLSVIFWSGYERPRRSYEKLRSEYKTGFQGEYYKKSSKCRLKPQQV